MGKLLLDNSDKTDIQIQIRVRKTHKSINLGQKTCNNINNTRKQFGKYGTYSYRFYRLYIKQIYTVKCFKKVNKILTSFSFSNSKLISTTFTGTKLIETLAHKTIITKFAQKIQFVFFFLIYIYIYYVYINLQKCLLTTH